MMINRTLLIALMFLVFITSLSVIWTKHQSRVLFLQLQTEKMQRDAFNTQYGQLQLEQSTWATHARVERIARERLGMLTPAPEQVVVIDYE